MTGVSLTAEEARVLGCLMEKAVTTPDNYPLSVNALDQRVQPDDEPRPDRRSTASRPSSARSTRCARRS